MARTARDHELRVAMVWNQTLLGETVLRTPRPVVLGYGPDALFPLPWAQAARGDLTLLTPGDDGSYALSLPPDARGAVWLDGVRRDVSELVVSKPSLTLADTDFGVVSLGAASYFFQRTQAAPEPRALRPYLDGELVTSFGLSLFVHVCLLLLMALAQRDLPPEPSLAVREDLVARFMVTPPPEDAPPRREAGTSDDATGQRAEQPKEKRHEPRPRPRADLAEEAGHTRPARSAMVSKVRSMGLLGALSSGSTVRDALKGSGVDSLLSGLDGAQRTTASRLGTPGLRGVGAAGQGTGGLYKGKNLGTGLGKRGRGGAGGRDTTPSARGEAQVSVSPGRPQVSGYLSPEQVERVVRQNQAALRYCYEAELQRQRGLKGKLVVQWRVDARGLVPSARITSSTLRNASVEGCIVRQVKKWRFPKPDGGEVSVQYPFLFGVGG